MHDNSLGKTGRKTKLVKKGATTLSDLSEENEGSTYRSVTPKTSLKAGTNDTELCPLWSLAINGNKIKLQELIHLDRWNINEADHMVRTPLIYSVLGERLDCVQVLLKAGADINHFDIDHRTALHWAAYQGNHKLVKVLLSKGASNTAKDKEGRTPLHLATSHDNIKVLQTLLQYMGKDTIDTLDNKHWTALCWSVFYDRVDYAKLLLRHGASPINMDTESRTVLHLTSENKDTSIIKMLLEETREITNFADSEGRTLLHMAVGHSNYDLVKFLLSLPEIEINTSDNILRTPLHWAASLKNVSMIKLLLEHGADFSIGDKNGVKALHYVTQADDAYECAKVMLETKGVKDIPDNKNGTALMWAAVKGCDKILDLLLKKKCSNVNAVDVHNQTALHMSTLAGNLGCVKLLIKNGASVDIVDGKHHIPLFYACASGHFEIVTELLKHISTSNLEGRDLEGRSLLHYAAMVDRTNIIKILIQNKLNPNVKDNAGCPPLHFAAYGGFVHCMNVLLENSAKVNIQDNYGQTALHWACRSGSLDAVKLLVSRYKANVNVLENSHERFTPLDYSILGDHEDVAYYLTENNAYTVGSLKELFATKIQSVWRGYSFRKNFKEKLPLLLKHVTLQKASSDANPSESSIKRGVALSDVSTRNKLPYNLQDKERLVNDDTKVEAASVLPDNNYLMQPPVLHRQRSGSTLSAVSYSSKSSFHQHRPKSPKFSISDDNPMSLRKASTHAQSLIYTPRYNEESMYKANPKSSTSSSATKLSSLFSTEEGVLFSSKKDSSPISSTLFRYPIYNRQFSDQVFYGNRESIANLWPLKKSDQSNPQQNGIIHHQRIPQNHLHRTMHSPVSSSGSSEVIGIHLKKGLIDQSKQGLLEGNNLYNRNYSRYGNRELKKSIVSSSSESSFLFQAKQYKNNTAGAMYKKISDVQSMNSVNLSVISGNDSVYFAANDVDKPWDIYRREQKRINMIRQKTEAAVKIQRTFRNFLSRKLSGKWSKSAKTVHLVNDKEKNASLDNDINDDEEDDDDTILDESLSEQIMKANSDESFDSTDEETLCEVAALVIQLAWRQYLKKKLEALQNLEQKQMDENRTPKPLPSILVAQPSQDSSYKHENLTPMMEDSDNQSSVIESDSFDSSFEDRKLRAGLSEKKKLVSSLSFPLAQNVHTGNLLKKKSRKFSLKKRFLQRANTQVDEASATTSSPYLPSLASLQPVLGKNDVAGMKSGKSKLFLRGKTLKSVEQKMFYNGAN